jgi:hypothetical protein
MHGFDDKLLSLFEIVFKKILSFRGRSSKDGLPEGIEDSRFDVCKEQLQRKYDNSGMDAAVMASSVRVRCVCPNSWSALQKVCTSWFSPIIVYKHYRGIYHCSLCYIFYVSAE